MTAGTPGVHGGARAIAAWSLFVPESRFASSEVQTTEFLNELGVSTPFAEPMSTLSATRGELRLDESGFAADAVLNRAELFYYCGHGVSQGLLLLDGDNRPPDGAQVTAEEVRFTGGVKWAVFDACLTLSAEKSNYQETIDRWRQIFVGLRCLLGFSAQVQGWPGRGQRFAELLNAGKSVVESWRRACEETEAPGTSTKEDRLCPWACLSLVSDAGNTADDRWHPRVEAAMVSNVRIMMIVREL